MKHLKTCLLALLALALPAPGAGNSPATQEVTSATHHLPAEECVRLMRGARIARMQSDPDEELTKLEAAFAACPDEIGPIHRLMTYFQPRPELEKSFLKFRSLLLQRLEDPDHDLPIGVIGLLARNPDAGEEELRAILGNVSRQVAKAAEPSPALIQIQAELQRRLGQDEAAIVTLEHLWRLTQAGHVFGALIQLYFDFERWQDAADLMAPQVAKDGRFRFSYALALGKLGHYDEALKQVELLAKDTEGAAAAYTGGPGVIALETEGSYVIDVVRMPGLLGLLKQIAWDLRDLGQDAQAEQLFRGLLAQMPDDPELQVTVLNLYASEAERQGQAAALAESWQAETDANALFGEGTQRLTAGDAAGAIDLLRRAAPELPDLEPAWYNLGMAAYRLEDWETVASAFARAAELNPDRAQTFFFRGLALEKLGRCGEAVVDLERATELDPERSLAYYYLATCYRKLGNLAAAAAANERYDATRD